MLDKIQTTNTVDETLKKYAMLQEQAKFIEQELKAMKKIFEDIGTFSSENYICLVEKRERTVGPNKATLETLLGAETLAAHSKKTAYKQVTVKRKH